MAWTWIKSLWFTALKLLWVPYLQLFRTIITIHCEKRKIFFNIPEHPDIMAKVHFESPIFFSFVIYYHKKAP